MTLRSPGRQFDFLAHPRPLAFAHRGGALEAEENTAAAVAHAAALGYHYLETDVRSSRDGIAVLFHDAELGRITGRPGLLEAHDWADLRRMRTHGGQAILRLDELLGAWPQLRINLDLKCDAAVAAAAEAIERTDALDRVCAGSFKTARVAHLRRRLGDRLCWSPGYGGVLRLWLAGWRMPTGRLAFPAAQVPPRHHGVPVVTPRFLRAAHSRGIQVHVWTVDDAAEMEYLLDLGVDGLMTDRPSLLKTLLQRRGQWTGG